MTEIKRIEDNNNGEIPNGVYDIVRVKGIDNPGYELGLFKQTIKVFLENQDLNEEDSKWNDLLPEPLIKFTYQLEELDYHKDDLISHIPTMIYKLQDIKDWEWYSSKLFEDGFEVIMKGIFRGVFLPIIHHQGIPHRNMFIERDGKEYPTKAITDVLTYKKWNPETMILK